MEHIKNSIEKILLSLEKENKSFTIEDVWKDVVGEEIAKKTRVIRLRNKKLFVFFEETALVYELRQKYKRKYIWEINQILGNNNLIDIEFRVG